MQFLTIDDAENQIFPSGLKSIGIKDALWLNVMKSIRTVSACMPLHIATTNNVGPCSSARLLGFFLEDSRPISGHVTGFERTTMMPVWESLLNHC